MTYSLAQIEQVPRLVIAITPKKYDENLLDIKKCIEVVNTSQVRARGWYFPHLNRDALAPGERNQFLMNETESHGFVEHLEQWRLYRSGQFTFRSMLWDVPSDEVQQNMRRNAAEWNFRGIDLSNVLGFIGFVGIIYSIGEAYVFASRLAQSIPYSSDVEITIGLRGVKGWALGSNHPGVHLDNPYITRGDSPEHQAVISVEDLIANPLGLAVASTVELFQQFSWLDPSPAMIANWQREIFR